MSAAKARSPSDLELLPLQDEKGQKKTCSDRLLKWIWTQTCPFGLAFILAGLSSLVHLVPAAGSFWVLDVLGSFVAVAAFWLGLTACGIVLLRCGDTQTAQPALTTAERHSADVRS